MEHKVNVIDLSAGCGGFSVGFERAGYKVIKAVEFDKILNFDIYKKAIKIINDKNNIKKDKILKNQIRIDCDTFEKIEALAKYAEIVAK